MFILLGESGSADTVSQEKLSQGTLAGFGLCGMKKGKFLEVGDKTVSDEKTTIHLEWELVRNLDDMSVSGESNGSEVSKGNAYLPIKGGKLTKLIILQRRCVCLGS